MARIRLFLAIWAAKTLAWVMRRLGRRATQLPGRVAIKICPTILADIAKPERIVCVTGTNGKTTTSNILVDALIGLGYNPLNNRFGSNILAGVASCLISGVTWKGIQRHDVGVIEVDERTSRLILPHLAPDVLVCTNLTRDSIRRNAHPRFIAWYLQAAIPEETTLVLNADDLICSSLASRGNKTVYYGIGQQPSDTTKPWGSALDVLDCPQCQSLLNWDYWRYNHIGHARCPACGFTSPLADIQVTTIDRADRTFTIQAGREMASVPLLNDSLINVYNEVAAFGALTAFGISIKKAVEALRNVSLPEARFGEEHLGRWTVVHLLAKSWLGAACSRNFQQAADVPGIKAVLINIDDTEDAAQDCENTSWCYDADYEYLADDSIKQIILGGPRRFDEALRMAIAGVKMNRVTLEAREIDTVRHIKLDAVDHIVVIKDLHNVATIGREVDEAVRARLEAS